MRRRKLNEALERHEILKRTSKVVFDDTEYRRLVSEREDYPQYVIDRINDLVEIIKLRYPYVTDIHLVGSYANNRFIDENTSAEFKAAKISAGLICKVSDFDFETTPSMHAFFMHDGFKVHLCKHVDGRKINVFDTTWQF
jgi:hypothetical protein